MRLPFWNQQVACFALLCALLSSVPARGATVRVNCDRGQSISAALATLNPVVANTIYVSGTCHENVLIEYFDHLTLIAEAGASINDASGGTDDVVTIFHTSRVTMQGFTVNGGADCVVCQDASVCQFYGNTFQNGGTGANIFQAQARIIDDVFQNNGTGLFLYATADVWAIRVTVQGNQASGAHVGFGSSLHLVSSVVQNNVANGVDISNNSHALFTSATIHGNGGAGVTLESSSVAQFGDDPGSGDAITANAGGGVVVGDLSFASFLPNVGNNITGNLLSAKRTKDVLCLPKFSVARGALTNIGGGTTNCVEY